MSSNEKKRQKKAHTSVQPTIMSSLQLKNGVVSEREGEQSATFAMRGTVQLPSFSCPWQRHLTSRNLTVRRFRSRSWILFGFIMTAWREINTVCDDEWPPRCCIKVNSRHSGSNNNTTSNNRSIIVRGAPLTPSSMLPKTVSSPMAARVEAPALLIGAPPTAAAGDGLDR